MSSSVHASSAVEKKRPNRSAAERRAQRSRAEARIIGHILKANAAVSTHRGSAPTRLMNAVASYLQSSGSVGTPDSSVIHRRLDKLEAALIDIAGSMHILLQHHASSS